MVITELIFEKIVEIEVATFGMMAPAATATKPAINEYSMRSWPFVSFKICNFSMRFFIVFFLFLLFPYLQQRFLTADTRLPSADFENN